MRETINGMWVGKKLTRMELLTIKSFQQHGHKFNLWVYDEIETQLPDDTILCDANDVIPFDDVFAYTSGGSAGSFAGFSDVWRFAFLYKFGGWYVDMDVCCLRPFDFQREILIRQNRFNGDPTANIIRLPAKHPFAKAYSDMVSRLVVQSNVDFYLPLSILGVCVAEYGMQQYFADYEQFVNILPYQPASYVKQNPKLAGFEQTWRQIGRNTAELDQCPLEVLLGRPYAFHWGNERLQQEHIDKNTPTPNSIYASMVERYGA